MAERHPVTFGLRLHREVRQQEPDDTEQDRDGGGYRPGDRPATGGEGHAHHGRKQQAGQTCRGLLREVGLGGAAQHRQVLA